MCDPIGSFLFIAGTTLILLSMNWGGVKYPWNSAYVAAPLSVGLVVLVFFGLYGKTPRSTQIKSSH